MSGISFATDINGGWDGTVNGHDAKEHKNTRTNTDEMRMT